MHTYTCTCAQTHRETLGKEEAVFLPLGTFEDSVVTLARECVTQKPNIDAGRLTKVMVPGVCLQLIDSL